MARATTARESRAKARADERRRMPNTIQRRHRRSVSPPSTPLSSTEPAAITEAEVRWWAMKADDADETVQALALQLKTTEQELAQYQAIQAAIQKANSLVGEAAKKKALVDQRESAAVSSEQKAMQAMQMAASAARQAWEARTELEEASDQARAASELVAQLRTELDSQTASEGSTA